MQVVLYFLALMTTLVAALPTTYSNDGRGATIFTSTNFGGASTAIPGNAWCTDLSNLFGSFEGKVRSLSVESGYQCQFYIKSGCTGDKLDLRGAQSQSQLGYGFDNNLYSALCSRA